MERHRTLACFLPEESVAGGQSLIVGERRFREADPMDLRKDLVILTGNCGLIASTSPGTDGRRVRRRGREDG